MDPAKLKVVELRAELAKRGLDQKGVKAVLVARLQEALKSEGLDEEEEEEEEDEEYEAEQVTSVQLESQTTSNKEDIGGQDEISVQSVQSSEPEVAHPEEDSVQFVSYAEESESKLESEVNEGSVTHPPDSEASSDVPAATDDTSVQSVDFPKQVYEMSGDSSEPIYMQSTTASNVPNDPDISKQEDDSKDIFQSYEDDSSKFNLQEDSSSKNNYEDQSLDMWTQQDTNQEESEKSFKIQDRSFSLDDSNAQDAMEDQQKPNEVEEVKFENKELIVEKNVENEVKMEELKEATQDQTTVSKEEIKEETEDTEMSLLNKSDDLEAKVKEEDDKDVNKSTNDKEKKNRWDTSHLSDTKKRPHSPSEQRTSSPPRKPDDEPDFDEKAVLLSWYDSDLHMLIDKSNFFSATLITHSGFGYVWAGVRATYGFEKGKIYYEVRITEHLKVTYLENEPHPNILRVGWSVSKTSLQLGEEPLSYGFGGSGKISTNCQFQNYGKPFVVNDVIGCFLNFDSNQIEISYTLNGEYQGVAYNVDHEELKGQPLFPHILSKNCSFEVNFGNRESWAVPLTGFVNVGEVPLEDRVMGAKRPDKREDCEVIMLVGLPGSGKTTWANKYAAEHKEKMYNILGTNALIDKMKVMGMPRRRNYSGRWEVLIAKCTKCLNTLLEIGAFRRRNYIIDQTNVYPTAQRRKMREFEGFVRRAVVIVPTDQELKSRTAKREAEEGKDVPDSAILEMKANFALPEKGDIFDEVIFTELQEEEAKAMVLQYNKEGNDHGYFSNVQQQKRFRVDDNRNDRRDFRYDGRTEGGDQRRMENRGRQDNRGGSDNWRGDRRFNNRRRGDHRGGWGGPPRPGCWRDNRGGGVGWRGGPPNRFSERGGHGPRDMRDRNRDYRDRRDPSGGGGKMPDRRGDRDDKNRQKLMAQGQPPNWGGQNQGGYNQGWSQNYGNQPWGNWNQGYNQQQWKNYGQQPQQQVWGQQSWGNQGWGNAGWNQQYYNQYQQNWTQQQQAQGIAAGGDSSHATGSDNTTMATSYSSFGQGAGSTQAGSWPGYTTVGSTGYASDGSTGGSGGSSGGGGGSGNTSGSPMASYTTMQKQYRQDPRKAHEDIKI